MTMTALLRADGRVVHFAPTDGPERITFVDPDNDRPGEVDVETVTAHLVRTTYGDLPADDAPAWEVELVEVKGTYVIDGEPSGLTFRADFHRNEVRGRRWHLRDLPTRLYALVGVETTR